MKKQLLPVGFYDLLFDEAKKNHENINDALEIFFSKEYRLIKTPLVEFEDSFDPKEINNSFRGVDTISGKNLVFRNDITLQISRLISTRLQKENLPLKLCYVGDVLCAKSEDLYVDRQQTQLGIEIIGCNKEKSEFEIVEILITTLQKLKINDLLIEFSLPNFLDLFLQDLDLKNNKELEQELIEAIMQKNLSQIRKLAKNNSKIIEKITLSNDDLESLSKEILLNTKSPEIEKVLQKAKNMAKFLQENYQEIKVRFDLFGDHSSSYHNGISFDIFAGNFSYPIASGGKYKINNLDAVGTTIYMNRLRKL